MNCGNWCWRSWMNCVGIMNHDRPIICHRPAINFNSLTSITPAVARAFTERRLKHLFEGLKGDYEDAFLAVANDQIRLALNHLTSLSVPVARELAKHTGVLSLILAMRPATLPVNQRIRAVVVVPKNRLVSTRLRRFLLQDPPSSLLSNLPRSELNMSNYYCKYCGFKSPSVSHLTGNSCSRHPSGSNKGKHALYEGLEKSKYTCKNCGQESPSLTHLTANNCPRHSDGSNKGKHEPAI
jgi:hypothetical protein